MKKKRSFASDCGVGILLVLAIFCVVVVTRMQNGIEGSLNLLPFIAPIVFIPLLVAVLYQKKHSCYKKLYGKGQGCYSKGFCTTIVSGLLVLVTLISAIIIYYGW